MAKKIALKGDFSDHGGIIITSNQDGTLDVGGIEVAVEGAVLACPIHGNQEIHGNLAETFLVNGKKVVLEGSLADCGAQIMPLDRSVTVE